MSPSGRASRTGRRRMTVALMATLGSLAPLSAQTSFDWLSGAVHPRGMALANAMVAAADPAQALGMNPAGLRFVGPRRSLQLGLRWYPAGISQKMTQLIFPGERQVFGVELRSMGYGTFEGYDEHGQRQEDYTAVEALMRGGIMRRIGASVSVGGSAGILYGSLARNRALAVVWSIGVQAELPRLGARLGAVVQNQGRFVRTYAVTAPPDKFPSAWFVGLSKALVHLPLTLYVAGGQDLVTHQLLLRLGGEFKLPRFLVLRVGLDQGKLDYGRGQASADLFSGLSVGFGTQPLAPSASAAGPGKRLGGLAFDGAVKLLGPLGMSSSFALGLRF